MEDFMDRVHDHPPLAGIAFAATMVTFTLMRLEGKQHLLQPHQGSIGIAVAWTIVSSVLAMYEVLPQATTLSNWFPMVVLLPQQLIFIWALTFRRETSTLVSAALSLILVASMFLMTLFRDPALFAFQVPVTGALAFSVLCFLVGLIAPLVRRNKVMLVIWSGMICLDYFVRDAEPVYVPLVVMLQELSLLNVKINYFKVEKVPRKDL